VKIKSLASSALALAFVTVFLLPTPAQATDGCDIFSNSSCEATNDDYYMQFLGQEIDYSGITHSITLSNPQSRVAVRFITPGEPWFSERSLKNHYSSISCEVDEETYFNLSYATSQGVTSDVIFGGISQTVRTSINPHGVNFLVTASFEVPQFAILKPYSCHVSQAWSDAAGSGFGDGFALTLALSRSFTPSTSTPSASTPATSTPSTATPSTSASPRVTSSPLPLASAESNDEESEVETRSSEVAVSVTADSESAASPIGFFLAGTLSALAGVGATVAFFQRKVIMNAISKFKNIAKH